VIRFGHELFPANVWNEIKHKELVLINALLVLAVVACSTAEKVTSIPISPSPETRGGGVTTILPTDTSPSSEPTISIVPATPEAPAPIELAHPKNSAECNIVCPKITLDNLNRIHIDSTPLTPNINGMSGIVIGQGINTEVHITPDNSIYLGALNVEFPNHPDVTGVLAAIKTINTERSEQNSVVVYLLQLVDGTLKHTTADVDKMLEQLNSRNFNITAVSKFHPGGNGTEWNIVAREITDSQDLGPDPLNPVNYDKKIIIN